MKLAPVEFPDVLGFILEDAVKLLDAERVAFRVRETAPPRFVKDKTGGRYYACKAGEAREDGRRRVIRARFDNISGCLELTVCSPC